MSQTMLLPDEPIRFTPQHFNDMLLFCVNHEASDITLQSDMVIYAEVHGRLHPITARALTSGEVGDLLNTIYGPNGTTQIASGRDVDTHYEIRPNRQERFRFRVNATGCLMKGHEGLQITIRAIPTDPPLLDTLGLEDDILEHMAPHQGAVIVTGSTGSGKSTLLAAMIRKLAEAPDSNRKILTYEAPIEFVYDNLTMTSAMVSQSEIPRHLPNFADGVRNALRRKPGMILVGEARDPDTISAVIDAALTGHPVYTTLHSNGVADCVRRMVSVFPAEERHGRALDILETVRLVIWQKLVPTVEGKRVALREYLVFNEQVRDTLVDTPIEQLAEQTRKMLKKYGRPMIKDAEAKYKEGVISEREWKILAKSSELADKDAKVRS